MANGTENGKVVNTAALAQQTLPQTKSLQQRIEESVPELQRVLPAGMTADRMARLVLTTMRLNPKLYQCDWKSVLAAVFQSAALGLEPNVAQEAWILPYETKKRGLVAQFQIGAYGWQKLFYQHQNSLSITANKVHRNDVYEVDLGANTVRHVPPSFDMDRGPVVGYYAIGRMINGGAIVKQMSRKEAEAWAIRYSKSYDRQKKEFIPGTPYRDNFDSMAQVIVLRQVLKSVPKSVEIKRALAMDNTIKTAIEADMSEVPDQTPWDEVPTETEAEVIPNEEPAVPAIGEAETARHLRKVQEAATMNSAPMRKKLFEAELASAKKEFSEGTITEAQYQSVIAAIDRTEQAQ